MYTVDNLDRALPVDGIPLPDTGAPLPRLDADEREARVTYHASSRSGSDGVLPVTVIFSGCYALLFGPPNDEAFDGHPLADHGLESYGTFEVEQSSWIRTLERMNRVHPRHSPDGFGLLRHFVITFHDSTFECVAAGFSVQPSSPAV